MRISICLHDFSANSYCNEAMTNVHLKFTPRTVFHMTKTMALKHSVTTPDRPSL